MFYQHPNWRFSVLFLIFLLSACVTPRPQHVENICSIFRQYPSWYWSAAEVEHRWRVPIPVLMAIIHQESRFTANAKPPRQRLLGIIPWKRPSTSYGYTQALNDTWRVYQKATHTKRAQRDAFSDAADFIGWYASEAKKRLGIETNDTFQLYLAYHEGWGGYSRKSYLTQPGLIPIARKVHYRSLIYGQQFAECRQHLRHKPWYWLG